MTSAAGDDAGLRAVLHRSLRDARQALVWKLEGASEYDIRRPLTPTGTNLLGLVKHVASVEAGYLNDCVGRPFDRPLPWLAADAEPNADMWATADESRADIVELYRHVWACSDASIEALDLDAVGEVPWWPEERRHPTLGQLLVRMIAETNRHAGHADIVRELIDGGAGYHAGNANLPDADAEWWAAYVERVGAAAQAAPDTGTQRPGGPAS